MKSIWSERNDLGGKSTFIAPDAQLSKASTVVQRLISGDEGAFFASPENGLAQLISATKSDPLRAWLRVLLDSPSCQLEIHVPGIEEIRPKTLLRFVDAAGTPALVLKKTPPSSLYPPDLRNVFETVGEIIIGKWDEAGGLSVSDNAPESLAESWLPSPPEGPVSAAECFVFGDSPFGDLYCFTSEQEAVVYEHEENRLTKAGSLSEFLASYFEMLSRGEPFSPTVLMS